MSKDQLKQPIPMITTVLSVPMWYIGLNGLSRHWVGYKCWECTCYPAHRPCRHLHHQSVHLTMWYLSTFCHNIELPTHYSLLYLSVWESIMEIPLANSHWPFLKVSEVFESLKCNTSCQSSTSCLVLSIREQRLQYQQRCFIQPE